MSATPLATIPVGVVVERRKAASQWADWLWRPAAVLHGEPQAQPWTPLTAESDATMFYAGSATIALHRPETGYYRDNLASGAPSLWVALSPTEADPPYRIVAVTADPFEGEAYTE